MADQAGANTRIWWQPWLWWQAGMAQADDEVRRIQLTNILALIGSVAGIPYFVFFYLVHEPRLAFLVLPFVTAFLLTIALNTAKRFLWAKINIVCSTSIAIIVFSAVLGHRAGIQINAFAIAAIAPALFSRRQKWWAVVAFLIPISSLLLLEAIQYRFLFHVSLGPRGDYFSYLMSICIAFVIIFFCLQFYIILTTQYETSLLAANKQLETQRDQLSKAYAELQNSRQKIEQALQEKAEWQGVTKTIVTINHELNSPLTALMAGAQALQQARLDPEQKQKLLGAISMATKEIASIMSRLKTYDKLKETEYVGGVKMLDLGKQ